MITEPSETKEPEEVKGGIWQKSQGKPAGRMYKGGNQIHTNPDCPCYMLDKQSGVLKSGALKPYKQTGNSIFYTTDIRNVNSEANKGGASRFFYCAKASKSERNMGCEGLEGEYILRKDISTDLINKIKKHLTTV